jgi:hypothetical protein
MQRMGASRSAHLQLLYAGIGPFPQLVPDDQWIRAAAKAIRADGPEQFLVNMLHVLRESLEHVKVGP